MDFGQPLFLLPSGVHLRATLEMLVDSTYCTCGGWVGGWVGGLVGWWVGGLVV